EATHELPRTDLGDGCPGLLDQPQRQDPCRNAVGRLAARDRRQERPGAFSKNRARTLCPGLICFGTPPVRIEAVLPHGLVLVTTSLCHLALGLVDQVGA